MQLDRPSKCGIEIRSYTPAIYGGYFYNNSLDEGRECYALVREAVNQAISPDVKVILKRACTEFELHGGPSPFWTVTREQVDLEDYMAARVDVGGSLENVQTDYMLNFLFKRWTLWAHSHNDMSYLEYTDGKTLYPAPVTYHEGDVEEIKRDIQAARMLGAGVPTEKACEIRDRLIATAQACGLTPQAAGAALGYYDMNPLFIGEEDQTTFPIEKGVSR
jgi:hypothetical protein